MSVETITDCLAQDHHWPPSAVSLTAAADTPAKEFFHRGVFESVQILYLFSGICWLMVTA